MSTILFHMPDRGTQEIINDSHSIFIFKPFEKGYGTTIGNALRRVLLSSLEGYAITAIKISGIQHEFSTIDGVREDITEIIFNLKKLRFKKLSDKFEDTILLKVQGKEKLTGKDIAQATSFFEVLNDDFVVCHLDKSAYFEIELIIQKGKGYIPAEENKQDNQRLDVIAIDAIFTPIKNVKFQIENTRVEQKTDYDQLTIEIETDGSITPENALKKSAAILIEHFNLFSDENLILDTLHKKEELLMDEETLALRKLLNSSLRNFNLSVRAYNSLSSAGLTTLGDLVKLKEDELNFKNFGKKSLEELKELMKDKNLYFGMDISKYRLD